MQDRRPGRGCKVGSLGVYASFSMGPTCSGGSPGHTGAVGVRSPGVRPGGWAGLPRRAEGRGWRRWRAGEAVTYGQDLVVKGGKG